ncbi:hypothetical protein N657DRAFT_674162 [Parathielavia appendiculata]|uniref:Uncharacterized protein n=1 Tax=Parathielavia appendiculata TaxID=2587402 RepID=A0AAN6TUM4_9PEZI|nr:hypothetical protein N657DRAFT_674162 [Parathielavia appendiculata]
MGTAFSTPAPAWAALAGDLFGRSNYFQCHQNCVRGCTGSPNICQVVCNVACANAGEADEAAALAARESVSSVRHSLAARSNYVECHQNCVRGCPGSPNICQAVCNISCANAGEVEK